MTAPCPTCGNTHPDGSTHSVGVSQPRVPRVAASLEDLRVGMVVTAKYGGWWVEPRAINDLSGFQRWFVGPWSNVVILADPPPSPVEIPRELFDALHEAYGYADQNRLREAALTILQHVDGVMA